MLPVEGAVSRDAQVFPDFPGRYTPGEPVAVASLGFETVKDAQARVKELGLPLQSTTHAFPDEDEIAENALEAAVSGEKAPSEDSSIRFPTEETPAPGLNEEELAERREEDTE